MWPEVGVVSAVLAAYALIRVWRRGGDERALKWELANAPRTPIGRLSGGVACVVGRARGAGPPLTAPASGRRCLAFQLAVDETADGDAREIGRLVGAAPFWIEDDTGRALVDPGAHFALALTRDVAVNTAEPTEQRPELLQFLESKGVVTAGFLGTRPLPCREGIIQDGETVVVGGYVVREVDGRGERSGPRQVPTLISLRAGGPDQPLLISDAPAAVRTARGEP